MRTCFKQYLTSRTVPFDISIIDVTLHILVRHQLIRFGVYIQPRNIGTEQLVIVQLLSNLCDSIFSSRNEEHQVQQKNHNVKDGSPEIFREKRFWHGRSQSLDGSLVSRCAWTAVEDDGAESLAADVLGQTVNELDGALRTTV
jgi:hypothetical protein